MSDINCPYCDHPQDINHDDGQGYEEDQYHEQECRSCGKEFTFTTGILYVYEARKADCLNGGEHQLEPVVHYPEIWPDWVRCRDCEYQNRGNPVK